MQEDEFHEAGEGEHAGHHADAERDEEPSVDALPEAFEIPFQQQLPGPDLHQGIEAVDNLSEDAGQQGDRAAGHAGNDIGGAHPESFERRDEIFCEQSVHVS